MPQVGPEHTGMRIAEYRKLRHLTQRELADHASISYSTLTKVEQGERMASPSVLGSIARALRVRTSELIGQPYMQELRQDELDVLIDPIRVALDLYDLGVDPEIAPRPLADLHAESEQLCAAVRQTNLKGVATALPALIAEVTSAAHAQPSTEAWTTLAVLYRTAYDVTTKLGFSDLCAIALDRMAWAAERASDPVLAGIRQYLRSLVYMRESHHRTGERLVGAGLALLDQADAGRTRQVARGQLHLGAAVIAARFGDGDAADEHLVEAGRIAAGTGPAEQVHWLSFGPTNVEVHRVSVLAERGKYAEAVRAADGLTVPGDWPASRRAHHQMEVARAQVWIGRTDAAIRNAEQARAVAPQQMRYHPITRDTVTGLMSARRVVPESVSSLARWVGM